MRLIKKLMLIFLAIVATTTIILLLSSIFANPERFRSYINRQLSVITGNTSRIDGVIQWKLFPEPGIYATDITIFNDKARANYLLTIASVRFNLKLKPLLRGQLVFSELSVDGLNMQYNTVTTPAIALIKQPKPNTAISQPKNINFLIDSLQLRHATLTLIQHQRTLVFKDLQLDATRVNSMYSPVALQLKTSVESYYSNQSKAQAKLLFKGNAKINHTKAISTFAGFLDALAVNGQLTIQQLTTNHFKLDKISSNLNFRNKILKLNPLTLNFYQGESIGNLSYNLNTQQLQLNQTASGIDSAQLTRALFGQTVLDGKLDLSFHSNFIVPNAPILEAVTGNGNISIKDGTLNLLDFNQLMTAVTKKITQLFNKNNILSPPSLLRTPPFYLVDSTLGMTPFKLITTHYQLEKLTLYSDNFFLQTNHFQLKGQGTLNLISTIFTQHVLMKIIIDNPTFMSIQKLIGGSIPMLINGTLTAPMISFDPNKLTFFNTKRWLKQFLKEPLTGLRKNNNYE